MKLVPSSCAVCAFYNSAVKILVSRPSTDGATFLLAAATTAAGALMFGKAPLVSTFGLKLKALLLEAGKAYTMHYACWAVVVEKDNCIWKQRGIIASPNTGQ